MTTPQYRPQFQFLTSRSPPSKPSIISTTLADFSRARDFCDSWVVGFLEGPTMVSRTSDWRDELGRWLKPFLDRLGHKRSRLERAGVPAECRTARTKPEMALAEIEPTKPPSSASGSAQLTYPYRSAVLPSKSFAPRMISSAGLCPLYPRKRTSIGATTLSALCQNVWPGHAVQDGLPRSANVRAASMYQASEVEQFAPGHHGYPRASEAD